MNHLTDIDKAFRNLAGNPEAEIALHTGRDDACELVFASLRQTNRDNANQVRLRAWVWLYLGFAAGEKKGQRDENCEYLERFQVDICFCSRKATEVNLNNE